MSSAVILSASWDRACIFMDTGEPCTTGAPLSRAERNSGSGISPPRVSARPLPNSCSLPSTASRLPASSEAVKTPMSSKPRYSRKELRYSYIAPAYTSSEPELKISAALLSLLGLSRA